MTNQDPNKNDIIKKGILLEDEFVKIISDRIQDVLESQVLQRDKKEKVSLILKKLVDESAKHAEIFEDIIKRY
ncbi:hypothetical protein KKG41_06605 [Patescibacteria group bacterium]|nr:hypothetical protein [Patescibacteria group bacterium]MBU1890673.1 hypothetical protein [Patescibacteria group bacterium]